MSDTDVDPAIGQLLEVELPPDPSYGLAAFREPIGFDELPPPQPRFARFLTHMITVNELAAQGDLLFRRIDHMPADVEPSSAERIIVGHSETGHHHVVDGLGARLYERRDRDPFLCFLVVYEGFADVQHLRSYDTHETLRLSPGFWEVRRQREWVPEGFFYTPARD